MESGPKSSVETEPKPFVKVTIMRHEEPKYENVGHDLTDQGVQDALEKGRTLRKEGKLTGAETVLHSPTPRARGTAELVLEGADVTPHTMRATRQLRHSDMPDRTAMYRRFEELGMDHEAIARDHHTNEDLYEHSPDIIEPNSNKRTRMYRALEYLIRNTSPDKNEEAPTEVFSVSHYELISLFLADVFGMDTFDSYWAPGFGEQVDIAAYTTDNPERVRLHVTYNGHEKDVLFDRTARMVVSA